MAARNLENIWAENKIRNERQAKEKQAEVIRLGKNEEEAAAFEALVMEAQRWQQLQILDKYLDELSRTVPKIPAFGKWLSWARHRQHIFDPAQKRKNGSSEENTE